MVFGAEGGREEVELGQEQVRELGQEHGRELGQGRIVGWVCFFLGEGQ